MYVSEFGQEETSASTSVGVLLGSLFLVGASFALITLGDRTPVVGPSAPTLTELVYKFEAEVEAAAPVLEIRATPAPPLEISVADATGAAETLELAQVGATPLLVSIGLVPQIPVGLSSRMGQLWSRLCGRSRGRGAESWGLAPVFQGRMLEGLIAGRLQY